MTMAKANGYDKHGPTFYQMVPNGPKWSKTQTKQIPKEKFHN